MKSLIAIVGAFLLATVSLGCAPPKSGRASSDIDRPAPTKTDPSIRVEVLTDPTEMCYTIVLANTSSHPVAFFDDLSDNSQYSLVHSLWRAGPAQVRVWNSHGELLTSNDYHTEGWWDPSVFSSQAETLPAKMAELGAFEQREYTFTIQSACMGCPTPWGTRASATPAEFRRSLAGKQIQLRVQVFYEDPFLKTIRTVDTDRILIK